MSGDKAFAIFMVAFLMGVLGSMIVGWPALACAAVAISAMSFSKEKSE